MDNFKIVQLNKDNNIRIIVDKSFYKNNFSTIEKKSNSIYFSVVFFKIIVNENFEFLFSEKIALWTAKN